MSNFVNDFIRDYKKSIPILESTPTVTALELTGEALALPALAGRRMLRIQNTSRGDSVAWIGGEDVDYASRNGLRLAAGESLEIAATDVTVELSAAGYTWTGAEWQREAPITEEAL